MSDFSLAISTTNTRESAQALAALALEKRLAACIQITQVESHYIWKDAIQCDNEFQLQMKIRTSDFVALCAALKEIHPYELPEFIRMDIAEASPAYLEWMNASTGPLMES